MDKITVLIPTSPIPSHPSTEIIEAVIHSIRAQLPDCPIWILCDDVRSQMEHRAIRYVKYLENLYAKNLKDVTLRIFQKHRQQSGMLMKVIDAIPTPLLYFSEHDCEVDDKPIDWKSITDLLESGEANTVRLYWHQTIHPEHEYLMLERFGDFVKTKQWSSWPHVSRVDFYRKILAQHFTAEERVMTETRLYSPVLESPWEEYKTVIYAPQPDAIRFHHLNARRDPITGVVDPCEW